MLSEHNKECLEKALAAAFKVIEECVEDGDGDLSSAELRDLESAVRIVKDIKKLRHLAGASGAARGASYAPVSAMAHGGQA